MKGKILKKIIASILIVSAVTTGSVTTMAAENKNAGIAKKASARVGSEEQTGANEAAAYGLRTADASYYEWDELETLWYINQMRQNYGLQTLCISPSLQNAANIRHIEMATLFDNTRPNGTPFETVLDENGIYYLDSAENLVKGSTDLYAVVDYMVGGSDNYLKDSQYTQVGIGTGTYDSNWAFLFVEGCAPQSLSTGLESYEYWVLDAGSAIEDYWFDLYVTCQHETSYTIITDAMCSYYNPYLLDEVQDVTVTYGGKTVTLRVLFQEPMQFWDVKEGDWYYEYVQSVYNSKLMTGLNKYEFGPTQPLARAQFALMLHRMDDLIPYTNAASYPDVTGGAWYYDAVMWASERGIITGYSNGYFGPNDYITREQMAVMMYRFANYWGYDTGYKAYIGAYQDAYLVNDYAKEAMAWAVGSGIITGKYGGSYLASYETATRAECATIISRFVDWANGQ